MGNNGLEQWWGTRDYKRMAFLIRKEYSKGKAQIIQN